MVATNNTFTFPVAAKVLLQGPYSANDTMAFALSTSHFMPKIQPYSAAPWAYAGTEFRLTRTFSLISMLPIGCSLNYGAPITAPLYQDTLHSSRMMGQFSKIMGLRGPCVPQTLANGYTIWDYVVLKHRNHLAIMSYDSLLLPNDADSFDFTSDRYKIVWQRG